MLELFNLKPYRVIGARMVKGRAMSGSHCTASVAPDAQAVKMSNEKRKQKNELLFRATMKDRGWLKSEEIAGLLSAPRSTTLHNLTALMMRGLVERKERQINSRSKSYRWRWKDV